MLVLVLALTMYSSRPLLLGAGNVCGLSACWREKKNTGAQMLVSIDS